MLFVALSLFIASVRGYDTGECNYIIYDDIPLAVDECNHLDYGVFSYGYKFKTSRSGSSCDATYNGYSDTSCKTLVSSYSMVLDPLLSQWSCGWDDDCKKLKITVEYHQDSTCSGALFSEEVNAAADVCVNQGGGVYAMFECGGGDIDLNLYYLDASCSKSSQLSSTDLTDVAGCDYEYNYDAYAYFYEKLDTDCPAGMATALFAVIASLAVLFV